MWIHHGYTFIQFGSRFTDMFILWIKWERYVVCVQMSQKYQNKYVICLVLSNFYWLNRSENQMSIIQPCAPPSPKDPTYFKSIKINGKPISFVRGGNIWSSLLSKIQ